MGLIELVGDPPVMPTGTTMPTEHKIKFRNYHESRLSFDTLKSGVDPEGIINIPVSLLDCREISNAIAAGWLVNMEEPPIPQSLGAPVVLDEVGADDIVETETQEVTESVLRPTEAVVEKEVEDPKVEVKPTDPVIEKKIEDPKVEVKPAAPVIEKKVEVKPKPKVVETKRKYTKALPEKKQTKQSSFKAKPITRGDDGEGDDLFTESKVLEGPPKKKRKVVMDEDDMLNPSEVKLPESKAPVDISTIFAKK